MTSSGDEGAELLVSAERSGFQAGYVQVLLSVFLQGLLYEAAGGAGADETVSLQGAPVEPNPFYKVFLAVVVCH